MILSYSEALHQGTGIGVKIGVLDTGIANLPDWKARVGGHFRVVDENRSLRVIEKKRGEDELNHGTACADIIHRYAPDAMIYDVQVMDYKAQNSRYKLVAGIRFGMEQGWDILNICTGTATDVPQLRAVTRAAREAGMILLSAVDSDGADAGFPAAYPDVISVEHDYFKDPLTVQEGVSADLSGHGVYVEARNAFGQEELFTGSSFACPHLTALVARLRQYHRDRIDVKEALLARGTSPGT